MTRRDSLPAELQRLLDAVDACERDAEALVADLTEHEVNWQERPGASWSVGQCLDHLAVTNGFYIASFVPLVEQARTASPGPFRGLQPTAIGRWFVRFLEPPVKTRSKAPKQVVPRSSFQREGLVEAFKASHDPYRSLVRACADVDVNRIKGANPFQKLIRMRVSTVLQIIPAHDRRHLWQAANVKRALRSGG